MESRCLECQQERVLTNKEWKQPWKGTLHFQLNALLNGLGHKKGQQQKSHLCVMCLTVSGIPPAREIRIQNSVKKLFCTMQTCRHRGITSEKYSLMIEQPKTAIRGRCCQEIDAGYWKNSIRSKRSLRLASIQIGCRSYMLKGNIPLKIRHQIPMATTRGYWLGLGENFVEQRKYSKACFYIIADDAEEINHKRQCKALWTWGGPTYNVNSANLSMKTW